MPDLTRVIDSDPTILGGTPAFVGTRVPAQSLIDYLAAEDSLNKFLDAFPSLSRNKPWLRSNGLGKLS